MGWWSEWRKRRQMGRLSPGQPHYTPGFGAPPVAKKIPVKVIRNEPVTLEACDRCGYSTIDGNRISSAKVEIKFSDGTSIFLCGNHYRRHRLHILERGYEVREHESADPH